MAGLATQLSINRISQVLTEVPVHGQQFGVNFIDGEVELAYEVEGAPRAISAGGTDSDFPHALPATGDRRGELKLDSRPAKFGDEIGDPVPGPHGDVRLSPPLMQLIH